MEILIKTPCNNLRLQFHMKIYNVANKSVFKVHLSRKYTNDLLEIITIPSICEVGDSPKCLLISFRYSFPFTKNFYTRVNNHSPSISQSIWNANVAPYISVWSSIMHLKFFFLTDILSRFKQNERKKFFHLIHCGWMAIKAWQWCSDFSTYQWCFSFQLLRRSASIFTINLCILVIDD